MERAKKRNMKRISNVNYKYKGRGIGYVVLVACAVCVEIRETVDGNVRKLVLWNVNRLNFRNIRSRRKSRGGRQSIEKREEKGEEK